MENKLSPALLNQPAQAQAGLEKAQEEGWEQPPLIPQLGHLTLLLSVPLFLPVKRGETLLLPPPGRAAANERL